jgi:hypothetical protein
MASINIPRIRENRKLALQMVQIKLAETAPIAPFRRLPQQFPRICSTHSRQPAQNRSIRNSNTTSCALYLTHPTEGGTFTTATLQSVEDVPANQVRNRLTAPPAEPTRSPNAPQAFAGPSRPGNLNRQRESNESARRRQQQPQQHTGRIRRQLTGQPCTTRTRITRSTESSNN